MPCSGPGGPSDYEYQERIDELTSERDQLTRMLCGVIRDLKRHEPDVYDDLLEHFDELQNWWTAHQELDRKRAQKRRIGRRKKLREIQRYLKEYKSDTKFLRGKLRQLKNMADDDYDPQDFNFERDW